MLEKEFTTYCPENHGQETGSNNGNYAQHANFRADNEGRYFVKHSSSGDGDMFPHQGWEEKSFPAWLGAFVEAAIEEFIDFEVNSPNGHYVRRRD